MTYNTACARARSLSRNAPDGLAYVVRDDVAGEIDRTYQPWTYASSEEMDTYFCGQEAVIAFERGEISQ